MSWKNSHRLLRFKEMVRNINSAYSGRFLWLDRSRVGGRNSTRPRLLGKWRASSLSSGAYRVRAGARLKMGLLLLVERGIGNSVEKHGGAHFGCRRNTRRWQSG